MVRRRPDPVVARPPRLPLLVAAGLFFALAGLLAGVAVRVGAPIVAVNAVLPAVVGVLLAVVALRQRVRVDREGVRVEGFGAAGRTVAWKKVARLELTDVSPLRTGPRLLVRDGRALPVPPSWRTEDGGRLPETVVAWCRYARIEVVGERLSARRWPIFALVAAGAAVGTVVAAVV